MRLAALCVSLLSLASATALAQSSSPSPAERRDQIAKVQEMLADPDPLLRLANMESIVSSKDSLKLQVAMRTALSSDDPDLRGLAMRAYLATRKELTFDIVLPPSIQKEVDAVEFDQAGQEELGKKYSFLPRILASSSRFHLSFVDYAVENDVGTVSANGKFNFNIIGDKLSTLISIYGWGDCYLDFKPSRKLTFEGMVRCAGWPPLAVSAPVF